MMGVSQQQGQFRYGRYLGLNRKNNGATAPFFAYELMGEQSKSYNQIVQNLITVQDSVIIRTSWQLDWRNQAQVQLQDGKIYLITNIKLYEEEINPQAFSVMRKSADTLYYLELVGMSEC